MDWLKLAEILLPAIVAAVVGLLTLLAANKQQKAALELGKQQIAAQLDAAKLAYRADVLSQNRVRWIEMLRSELSALLGTIHHMDAKMKLREPPDTALVRELITRAMQVTLMLNPNEQLHKALLDSLASMLATDRTETAGKLAATIQSAASAVMKVEWEKVKRGE